MPLAKREPKDRRFRDGQSPFHIGDWGGEHLRDDVRWAYAAPPVGNEKGAGVYADVPGFCKSATLEEIQKHDGVLTPGRYVGAEAVEEDDEPFDEKMKRLTAKPHEQFADGRKLKEPIKKNLKGLGYGG